MNNNSLLDSGYSTRRTHTKSGLQRASVASLVLFLSMLACVQEVQPNSTGANSLGGIINTPVLNTAEAMSTRLSAVSTAQADTAGQSELEQRIPAGLGNAIIKSSVIDSDTNTPGQFSGVLSDLAQITAIDPANTAKTLILGRVVTIDHNMINTFADQPKMKDLMNIITGNESRQGMAATDVMPLTWKIFTNPDGSSSEIAVITFALDESIFRGKAWQGVGAGSFVGGSQLAVGQEIVGAGFPNAVAPIYTFGVVKDHYGGNKITVDTSVGHNSVYNAASGEPLILPGAHVQIAALMDGVFDGFPTLNQAVSVPPTFAADLAAQDWVGEASSALNGYGYVPLR